MSPSLATLGVASVAGLALGSFAVTAGLRWSRGEGVLRGRSRCDACGRTLNFAQTVPLVSYVALGGSCGDCGGRIDRTHLAGEAAGAVALGSAVMAADTPLEAVLLAGLGLVLIAACVVDAKTQRLPDPLTATVAALAAALAAVSGPAALMAGAATAIITGALLLSLRWFRARRDADPGLGLGDVKLIGGLSLWLGLATPWMVVVAACLGLMAMTVLRPSHGRLAFGPCLAASAWIVGLSQEVGPWPTTM